MANLQDITNRSEVGAIKPWGKAPAPAGYVLCVMVVLFQEQIMRIYLL